MGPNFSPIIAFNAGTVMAMGPLGEDDLHRKDLVQELRAWVYQPATIQATMPTTPPTPLLLLGPDDAAATDAVPSDLRQGPGVCWMLPLTTITSTPFRPGRAFAVAVALISTDDVALQPAAQKRGRVIWWGHPIWLTSDANAFGPVQSVFDQLEAGRYPDAKYFDDLTTTLLPFGPVTGG